MKSKLIVNPVSGTDAAPDYLQTMNERLRRALDPLDIAMTIAEGDARRLAEQAVRDGYEQLFIAGGDGTLNEVLNGVAAIQGALARTTFGIIPLGTGNDFAAALGLPEEVEAVIEALLEGNAIWTDVGVLNDRCFVNVSAGGFIAEVSDAVSPELKTIAGRLAYIIGGAQVLMEYEPVGLRLRLVDAGGRVVEREMSMQMFAVCNSRLVGGGRIIAPHALIDDHLLDLCLVEAMPTLEFVSLLGKVSGGDHLEDERVTYLRARELELRFDRTIKVNMDGEVLETDRCLYRILPRATRFLTGHAPFASRQGS